MGLFRRIWFAVVLIFCLKLMLFGAVPCLFLLILWDKLLRVDRGTHRRRVAALCMIWSDWVLSAFCWLGRVRIECRPPARSGTHPSPAIVLVNHRSSFDQIMATAILRRLGHGDVRIVSKREVMGMPVIGRYAREMGCAFVSRGRDPTDLDRIRRCALDAANDGACVMIFPEGTTYGDAVIHTRSSVEYRNVLPPRFGGVRALKRALPDYPVLSMTVNWLDIVDAYDIFRLHNMLGRKLIIEVEEVRGTDGKPVEEWLTEEWLRKDERLTRT